MSVLKNGTHCVIIAGCKENIGVLVATVEHLGEYDGCADAYRIRTVSGRPFKQLMRGGDMLRNLSNVAITDRHKLRPLVEPGNSYEGLFRALEKTFGAKKVEA